MRRPRRPRTLTWPQRIVLRALAAHERGQLDADPDVLYRLAVRHLSGLCDRPLAEHPTCTAPGSAERLAVMVARAQRGEDLWHPSDRQDLEGLSRALHVLTAAGRRYRVERPRGRGSYRNAVGVEPARPGVAWQLGPRVYRLRRIDQLQVRLSEIEHS